MADADEMLCQNGSALPVKPMMTREELLAVIEQAQAEGATELDLSDAGLTELPPEIGKLTQLETLILGKVHYWSWAEGKLTTSLTTNQLTTLPPELAALENLQTLQLDGNLLAGIPDVVLELQKLKYLGMNNTGLVEVPGTISKLINLRMLHLNGNQITQISEVLAQLPKLTGLYLGANRITQISEAVTQLTELERLILWDNQITKIPTTISRLTKLEIFQIYRNHILEIPETIAQLTNLTTFYFDDNRITGIPEVITQLKSLKVLHFGQNQVKKIPKTITQLTKLVELSLWRNELTKIPETITQLTKLTKLYLGDNQITEIPESIAQLTNLTRLDLENNQIKELPEWLENLPKLEKLDLRGNPLPISPEVLGPADLSQPPGSVEGIFNYCRRLRSGEVRPLNEAKVLLVGQGSVGKTSLINRLLDQQYNPQEPQTDGLRVRNWNIHVNSKDVRLNVWDFGGQEIYHATHQFFLTKRSLYLLVCNCRISEAENRVEYWLKLIESFGDRAPVILVGNKCDEQLIDLNRRALQEKYPNIKAILETSCQTNQGIAELQTAITHEIAQLKEVYDLLPLSWFQVKEHLEHLDKDFIKYSQYACICDRHQISDDASQEQLIDLLHNLGLVLNFRQHPFLQTTSVLNPDWVTSGIYSLLSDDSLKAAKGILTPADLSRILEPQRYPIDRHHYLTGLMQEFQLCFPVSDRPNTFLIPSLLPKEEPAATQLAGETLEFQYHYGILPASILSRFIVLTHEKIHQETYWRSGVMLAHCEGSEPCNIARVKADPEDRKIFISIDGRAATRRSFLMLLRDVFNRIHRSFANLDVSEWVPVPGHPDHPPLDYQELLGLEAMGEREHAIGKLRIKVNLRQLLDGYEPIELRQRRGDRDDFFDRGYNHYGDIIYGDKVGEDKVGNDKIGRDKL
jgi:internalin A